MSASIVLAIQNLKIAYDFFDDFIREYPDTGGSKICENYKSKIYLMVYDLMNHGHLPKNVRDGIKEEWQADAMSVPAITEKIAKLKPNERELIESVIDAVLKGEELNVEHIDNNINTE